MNAARISATSEIAPAFSANKIHQAASDSSAGRAIKVSVCQRSLSQAEGPGRTGRALQTVGRDPRSSRGATRIPRGNKGPRPKLEPSDGWNISVTCLI